MKQQKYYFLITHIILAISETHLDSTFEDAALIIQGYNIFRRDRNKFGGGVVDHIPVKIRRDLMQYSVEVLQIVPL